MYGVFINEDRVAWAQLIVQRIKLAETRSRNMLKRLVGDRVAIISTQRGRKPMIIGYADITSADFVSAEDFFSPEWVLKHQVLPGMEYACTGKGKWCYTMSNAEPCEPYLLPEDAIRHGRSYVEF